MIYHSFFLIAQAKQMIGWHIHHCLAAPFQWAKKVVSDSPWLVNSLFNLPDGQLMFLRNSNNRRTVKSILLVKNLLGLVQMTSGLVNASFSSPEWQAVKMIFFAPYFLQIN